MDWLDSLNLPPELAGVATIVFVLAGALFAAWSRTRGRREGPPQPKVQEFYASGQLADMGPVKELVEQTGLLVQQQVRSNLALEGCAVHLGRLAEAYIGALKAEQDEQEIAAEVERRVDVQLRERRRRARRPQKLSGGQ